MGLLLGYRQAQHEVTERPESQQRAATVEVELMTMGRPRESDFGLACLRSSSRFVAARLTSCGMASKRDADLM